MASDAAMRGVRIRIVVADDHPIVAQGLCRLAEAERDITVVAQPATIDALWQTPLETCHVVVLDLSMPGAQGLSALRELRIRYPHISVLVLSVAPEEQFALRVFRAGAAGYLPKRSAPEALVEAIRRVAAGGIYTSIIVSRQLAIAALRPALTTRSTSNLLSDREIDVLRLYAGGLSATRIAVELSLSIKTVSTYRKRLLEKLGLSSTAALIRYAIHEHLID
jgi:DNA-binding NarL/FixJ family response regulator